MDQWLNLAAAEGMTDIMYTFGEGTPPWISSNPTDPTCSSAPGWCDPPSDISTGDTSFKNFVTALVQHVAGQVAIWECINEPNAPNQWTGTIAQDLTMCTDMYNIVKQYDPAALVAMPAVANGDGTAASWLTSYFQAGGAAVANTVGFHGYARPDSDPELISSYAQSIVSLANAYAVGYPVWDTEVGFFNTTTGGGITDPDQQAAYTSVVFLLEWAQGVSRVYWYSYGNGATGTLTNSDGSLNEAGTAYVVTQNWMVGSTMSAPCANVGGTVWTCGFTSAGAVQEQAVWDAGQSCNDGVCSYSNYRPSSIYQQYVDLEGNTHAITGGAVQIGIKPILLQE